MTIVPLSGNGIVYPAEAAAAEVAVEAVNAEGGVAGHPIDLIICNDKNDPNEAAKCGREAVEEDVAGVVGSYSLFEESYMPTLDSAKIPYISPCCATAHLALTSEIAFNTTAGALLGTGFGIANAEAGCKSIALLELEIPTREFSEQLTEEGLEYKGFDGDVKSITVQNSTTDYSGIASEATEGVDCIDMELGQQEALALLPAIEKTGADVKLFGTGGNSLALSVIEKNPGITDGATVLDYYPPITAEPWKPFIDAFAKYAKPSQQDEDLSLLGAETAWVGYEVVKQVGSDINGDVTAGSMLEALQKATDVTTNGVTPPLDLTKRFVDPETSSVYNPTVTFELVKDGELTWPDETFHDLAPVFEGE